ncbi:hypothetical protein BDC45DRAFT_511480 [Circinella umbellata]|nr:hypothetical protein BDC45DRAFT_511480 [Circinella umbellata]
MVKLVNAQNRCVEMALNRKASKQSATIVPMVLADLPSMKLRARTLQLKFAARLQTLLASSMARSVELTFLWDNKQPNKQWKTITTNNRIHQRYNKLRNSDVPPINPVHQAITEKRNEEYTSKRNKFKSISCMRINRIIDPILYQPAFSRDRHRLIKWRMHWLPSYPLKDCRCGHKEARREHFATCPLLQSLLLDLTNKFGAIPELPPNMHQLDHILNLLPQSEVGLVLCKWKTVWPALIRVLREIDFLSHPDDIFDEDEPAPEEALEFLVPPSSTSPD